MRKTVLHQSHIDLGAKMGEFAGYDMPLFYGEGVIREHEWTRAQAGIFDVSHMGQIVLEGPGAAAFLEYLTPSAFQSKTPGRAQYTVLTNEEGGIIDDLIVTRLSEDRFFVVVNAGCKDKDIAWIKSRLPPDLKFEYWEDRGLIALQGPEAESVLGKVLKTDFSGLPYMKAMEKDDLLVSRLGYTGEDGFEISLPKEKTQGLWQSLLNQKEVKPVGLAARDSLRLEMGYCLYGHDIDEQTSLLEAGLGWVIGKGNMGFIGAEQVFGQALAHHRVGVRLLEPGVAREGAEIRDSDDKKIGELTSGGFSPSLKQSIGQGYIESSMANVGQKVFVNVRGRNIAAEVVKMPFVPPRTKAKKKEQ